jgi:hypothetical protein
MILKIFSQKKLALLTQNKANFFNKFDHNTGFFRKTPIFSPKIGKNRRKL